MQRSPLFLAAAVLIACAAAWPLLSGGGLLNTRGGGDSPFLLQRLQQLETAVADGHFPVRWMPDANYGYGYPFFNFYAPFAFYVALPFRWLGFSLVQAIQLSQLAAFVTAAAGMFALTHRWFQRNDAALLASAAYTLAPFHLVNVYVRGDSIAEFWAMAWYPLVILGVDRLGARRQGSGVGGRGLGLGIAYAGLIVSHNISAMIFSPFVLLYAIFAVGRQKEAWQLSRAAAKSYGLIAASLLLGLALSAWFWLPALGERDATRLEEVTVGYFDYGFADGYHFRSADLVQSTLAYDPDVDGGRAFRMGLVQALGILAGAAALLLPRVRRRLPPAVWLALPASAALATFMITPASRFLWDTLPLLPYTQFPWRFLSVQAFWGGALTGLILMGFSQNRVETSGGARLGNRGYIAGIMMIGALLVANLAGLSPDYLPLTDEEITPVDLAQYEWFTGNVGTTISAEYLAAGVEPRVYTSRWLNSDERWAADVLAGAAEIDLVSARTQSQRWQITVAGDGAVVELPLMAWPGWTAAVGKRPAEPVTAAPGSGLVQLTLPAGEHDVLLQLQRTPLRLAGELISLLALLAAAGAGLIWWRPDGAALRGWLPAAGVLIAFSLLLLFLAERPAANGPATWDFAQMAYLHRQPAVPFGSGAQLGDYRYRFDPTGVRPGDTIEIVLDWTAAPAGEPREVTVDLLTPADHFYNFVAPLAADSRPLTLEAVTHTLRLPENAPAGLYLPRLTLNDDNRPRTPAGLRRGELFLAPLRILPAGAPAQPAGETSPTLDARPVAVTLRPDVDVLDVQLQYRTGRPLAENLIASLRLALPDGRQIYEAQFDLQPGYGYRPSGSWPAGRWIDDRLTLDLRDVTAEPPYLLLLTLYEPAGSTRLVRRLGELVPGSGLKLVFVPSQPTFEPPAGLSLLPEEVLFAGEDGRPLVELLGFEAAEREGDGPLALTLYWRALAPLPADYTHFVHLLDPESGRPLRQHDAMPQNNSYPTSQWQPGEVVADPALLVDLEGLPAGRYQITAGFYREVDGAFPRLTPLVDGEPLPDGSFPLLTIAR